MYRTYGKSQLFQMVCKMYVSFKEPIPNWNTTSHRLPAVSAAQLQGRGLGGQRGQHRDVQPLRTQVLSP